VKSHIPLMASNTVTLTAVVSCVLILLLCSSAEAGLDLCMYRLPQKRHLAECTWYNSANSCCTVEDSEQVKSSWEDRTGKFKNATVSQFVTKFLTSTVYAPCISKLHLFVCFHCAPGKYMNTVLTSVLTVSKAKLTM
jgi:hypothetical protein